MHILTSFSQIAAWNLHEMNNRCCVISSDFTKQREAVVWKGRGGEGAVVVQINAIAFIHVGIFLARSVIVLQLFLIDWKIHQCQFCFLFGTGI